jgi:HAMP domain-containing protein
VRLAQVIDTRTDQSAAQALELDELNESLRADILGAYAGLHRTSQDQSDDQEDLQRLEVVAGVLRSSADPGVAALGKDEYGFVRRAETLLSMPADEILATAVTAFENSSEALTGRVDTYRDTLSARQSESSRRADEAIRTATIRLVLLAFAAAATLFVVGWVTRRRLLASLRSVASVARRVAEGNLDARTGSRESDEVGELAQVLDEMAATLQQA